MKHAIPAGPPPAARRRPPSRAGTRSLLILVVAPGEARGAIPRRIGASADGDPVVREIVLEARAVAGAIRLVAPTPFDADRPWRRAGAVADHERPNPAGGPIPADPIAAVAPKTAEAPRAVAALVRLLRDGVAWPRREAVIPALGRFGPDAAPALPRLRALAAEGAPFFAKPILTAIGAIEAPPTPPGPSPAP